MLALALEIRNNLQALTEQYDRLLVEIPTYAAMPAAERQEAAGNALQLIAAGLEAADPDLFLQFVRVVALERAAQGIDIAVVQQALNCLVEVIEPLFPDVQTANFLWRAMVQVNAALSDMVREQGQAAEERFRRLAENTQDGVTIIEGHRVIYVNHRLAEILGYSADELSRMSSLDFAAPEEKERLQTIMTQARQTGQSLDELEFWAICKDGSRRYLRNRYSMSRAGDKITGRYVFTTDMTAAKEAEETIRQSEGRYRALFEQANDAIFLESENDEIVDVNPRACELLGYSREELLRMTVPDLQAPEVRQAKGQTIKQELDQFHGAVFEGVDLHRDGTRIPVEVSTTPLGGGLVLSIVRDITERKRAEETLRQQQTLLRQVLDLNPSLIFVKDRESRFILANQALAEIYGTTVEDLIGKSDADFADPDQALQFHLDDLEVMDSQQERVIPDRPLTDAQGALHWVQAIKRPLMDADGVARRVLGVSTDITARKQLEQQIRDLLERRGQQVRTSTEIAQEIAAAPVLSELFRRVVTLIKERFDYYHAQIFRYEPAVGAVVLVAAYGEAGRALLEARHRLQMGRGVVGTAAATGRPVLATNVRHDPDWVPNPHLPQTQGELAVPIKWREQMLGILDVQSDRAGALTEEDQILLEGLCGQIAAAIESTRLRQEMEENLRELEGLYRTLSRQGWQDYQRQAQQPAYFFDLGGIHPAQELWLPHVGPTAERQRFALAAADERPAVVAPLAIRSEIFGALGVEEDPANPLSDDDLALVETIAEQVAQALESARLFEQTQMALSETRGLYEANRRLTEADTLQGIVAAVAEGVPAPAINRVVLWNIERDETGAPRAFDILANWHNGQGTPPLPLGTRFPIDQFPATRLVLSADPFVADNVDLDERLDPATRAVFQRQNARALAILPLWIGPRQVGSLMLVAEEPHHFDQAEIRPYRLLAGQMIVAVENRRLFEVIQARAARERLTRTITDQIRRGVDREAIMRIAVRELSGMLGASKAVIRLGTPEQLLSGQEGAAPELQ